jgi:phosphatidylglycerol lysyltransferase
MYRLKAGLARYRKVIAIALVVAVLTLGFVALERLTHEVRLSDVSAAAHALSARQIVLALLFTAGSYLSLTFYDVLALRVIGRPLPWRTAALASFTSYTLSHNLGMALLTGGAARYRIYTGADLDGADIARVVAISSGTFWAGVLSVTGAALLLHPGRIAVAGMPLLTIDPRLIGGAILAIVAAMVVACGFIRGPIRLLGFSVPLPRPTIAIAQIGIAVVDIAFASAALFVLIPGAPAALLPTFVLAYALGIVATVVTHVPGGLGIFEAVVLAVVPIDRATLFAALIAYRVIYYLAPLAVAVVLLAWREGSRLRTSMRFLSDARAVAIGIAPLVLSAATFLGGGMLLLSGSLPALQQRMRFLSLIMPLPFIEASHVAASLVGTLLLLLAPSLYRRLDGAFVATRALLIAGALFSLAKGIDYEEAIVCLSLAAMLQWTRGAFYRRTTLTAGPLSSTWLSSVAAVIALATWAGIFAYRHIAYSDDLWWEFAVHGDAPRFLRAMLGVVVLLTGAVIWRLMAPAEMRCEVASIGDVDRIRPILQQADRTDAMLALTGDKRFLVAEEGNCFLMYQVKGASWIVMGDPIGPRAGWADLLWRIRDLADRQQGRLMLYEVSMQTLDIALGMGLNVVKYGAEAIVDMDGFQLDTPRLRSPRRAERACAGKGAEFRIVPADAVPAIIDELREISDEWLAAKGGQEKGFSLGSFREDYICNFDVAVVSVRGRIVAFANLWLTANKAEASVDLMRHREETPAGTMDFLFVNLLIWAKAQGYRHFSLGIAPLSGIDDRRLAPAWAKAAAFIFRHGERFYGFRGLRAYKEKFAPEWEPRYIAGPDGLGLIQALHDLSRLVGNPEQPRVPIPANETTGVPAASLAG